MPHTVHNLRKAAVLLRSLDSATASGLLAQLPPADAELVRAAIRQLDSIDPEELADVADELRRALPSAGVRASGGVELALSSGEHAENGFPPASPGAPFECSDEFAKPLDDRLQSHGFDFLEKAPVASLVSYLSREHAQTVAVVLSKLPPRRAAELLGAIPAPKQANIIERLSVLGEMDAESVKVVEQELAAWVAAQSSRRGSNRANGALEAILQAADPATKEVVLGHLRRGNDPPPGKKSPTRHSDSPSPFPPRNPARRSPDARPRVYLGTQLDALRAKTAELRGEVARPERRPPRPHLPAAPPPSATFGDLASLDAVALSSLLQNLDIELLTLALAGATTDTFNRITGKLPKKFAREIRRRIQQLGPTRLSDMETAQRTIAQWSVRNQPRLAARS